MNQFFESSSPLPRLNRVYLAGPEVFFPEADAVFTELEALCASFGLEGVRPSDGTVGAESAAAGVADTAQRIFEANLELIDSCQAVLANVVPFRNDLEPDSGTVFEIGYAVAKRLPVATLIPRDFMTYRERVTHFCGEGPETNRGVFDAKFGCMIESFERPLNLMLSCATKSFHEPREALEHLSREMALTNRNLCARLKGHIPAKGASV